MRLRGLLAAGFVVAACSVQLAPEGGAPDASSGAAGTPPQAGAAGGGAGGGAGVANAGAGGTAGAAAGGGGTGATGGTGGTDASLGGAAGSGGSAGADAGAGALIGNFSLGYYWATTEQEFPGTPDTDLYDSNCALIATVTSGFASSLASIGTGKLGDGRVLAYDGACSCPTSPCYVVCDATHPWGYGV